MSGVNSWTHDPISLAPRFIPEYIEGFTDWPLDGECTDMADIYYKFYYLHGDKMVTEISYVASREMDRQELIDALYDADRSFNCEEAAIFRTNQ